MLVSTKSHSLASLSFSCIFLYEVGSVVVWAGKLLNWACRPNISLNGDCCVEECGVVQYAYMMSGTYLAQLHSFVTYVRNI